MDPLRLSILTVLLFLPADEGLLVGLEVVVVGVVEVVHLLGGAMGVIPDEGLWLVELAVLEERPGRMRLRGLWGIILGWRANWGMHFWD
jgi:hypothetical protein